MWATRRSVVRRHRPGLTSMGGLVYLLLRRKIFL
jgi:hypothetical protein